MKNIDSKNHVTGKSTYIDDIPVQTGTLYGAVFGSPIAHGKITGMDLSKAQELEGVEGIFTQADIPGRNQIGGIIEDEPLLAVEEVHFVGQPVAFVVAKSEKIARKAVKLIKIELEELEVITDPREAQRRGNLLTPPRTFKMGDVETEWANCAHIFEGKAENGGQEHLYIETQGSYAYPIDNGSIKIHSSTQGATAVQKMIARILGLSMHCVEVNVARLGGGFGGKEDQATPFACLTALASWNLQKPVKLCLHRLDDMYMTGKRHPYSTDFKIGLSKDLAILAFQTTMYQNGGAANDLSPAIMERTLFHSTNSYFIPNTEVTVFSCKTNLPPNTAFRGFGGPQGMFAVESAIAKAADALGVSKSLIQERNFLKDGDEFQYGQIAEQVNIAKCLETAREKYFIAQKEKEIATFNLKNEHFKKGMAIMPICFGISFTKTPMNQARALVHIYQDGSVGISTGAVEMGQGVNTKMIQVAARVFSIHPNKIKIESTNTTRVANTSPTAASSGADLNGNALRIACESLLQRLHEAAAKILSCEASEIAIRNDVVLKNNSETELTWNTLIESAFLDRVCLTENGHYATPIIYFDKTKEKGHPFAYHVYGIAAISVTVDCIRGTYEFDDVNIVHDFGNSLNTIIDIGQVEGALVQGIGWATMEEVSYDENGRLLSNSLSTYKVPDIYSIPGEINITPLETDGHELALLGSKAIGEPPFMYGIGAYFALTNAIRSFNPDYSIDFNLPLTPEKVLTRLYQK